MKLFVGLIFSAVVLQALALPTFEDMSQPEHIMAALPKFEDMSMPEHVPETKNDVVDAFREEIDRWFVRYNSFYDHTNAALRQYRLRHVTLVSEIYHELMASFGDRIEEVRIATYELNDLIDAAVERIGTVTPCIRNVEDARDANTARTGVLIKECATRANSTLSTLLRDVFYPTFAQIQTETSTVPISVIDVLSRGNVLEDETAILRYLEQRYTVLEMQWIGLVSQVLRWETNRFQNEGRFLETDTRICMEDATWEYLLVNSRLEGEIQQCT